MITAYITTGFDDPRCSEAVWMKLLEEGRTVGVNMTWRWQKLWWESFGKGLLTITVVEKNGIPIVIAPLFAFEGMIFNLCPEDYLDFIGDATDLEVLHLLLMTVRDSVPDFVGFRFYFIPGFSGSNELVKEVALKLNLNCYLENMLPSPFLDIQNNREAAESMTRKKSLRRHENYFLRNGELEVLHYKTAEDILPNLHDFFEQHILRRSLTDAKSIFEQQAQREYYIKLTNELSHTGWLRFTRINFNNHALCFHYGLSYKRRYLYGIPSFNISFLEHSPGEVLIRQVLLHALSENAEVFDLGIGDETYKYRFSTGVTELNTWGLYPL